MKHFILKLIAGALLACAIITLTACGQRGQYPAAGTVTVCGDTVFVEDSVGNIWSFEGAEDWETGDRAAMIMDDNGTKQIYDDAIMQIRYIG